nr:MAG TPA: hypothetical protein [Caudoviricetes sp.]
MPDSVTVNQLETGFVAVLCGASQMHLPLHLLSERYYAIAHRI